MNLSIVIPSFCRVDLLRPCLASIQRNAPTGTETIVVDDGSVDAAVSKATREFAGVRVLRHDRAQGFCAAANAGIAAATGEIVELLNDDTETTAGWVKAALARFTNPSVVAVAPLVLQHGTDWIIDSAGDEYDQGGFAFKRVHGERFNPSGMFGRSGWVTAASAAAAFYRRTALLAVGGFPESFGAYFDDVDLSLRLGRIGVIGYEPQSVVWHHVAGSHGRWPNRRLVEQQSRNEEMLYWRNSVGSQRWRTVPRHAAILTGKAILRTKEGMLLPWMRGRCQAWSRLLLKRASIDR